MSQHGGSVSGTWTNIGLKKTHKTTEGFASFQNNTMCHFHRDMETIYISLPVLQDNWPKTMFSGCKHSFAVLWFLPAETADVCDTLLSIYQWCNAINTTLLFLRVVHLS